MCTTCMQCCPQVGNQAVDSCCGQHNHVVNLVGTLIMSVDKDTYEELGLQGKNSIYQKHRYGEFRVVVGIMFNGTYSSLALLYKIAAFW